MADDAAERNLCLFRNRVHHHVYVLAHLPKLSVQQVCNIIGEPARLVLERL
jgi:hypothetical protein